MKKLSVLIAVIVFASFSLSAQVSSTEKTVQQKTVQQKTVQQKTVEQQKLEKQRLEKEKQTTIQQNDNPNAPEVKFDKVVHDYGTIEQHGDGNCVFTFSNTGKEPLILSNVRSSCGCTVPTWPRQPVLPGQSETIKVKYDTKRVGTINKSVHVYSNGKVSPIILKIKGKILAKSAAKMPVKEVDKAGSPVNK